MEALNEFLWNEEQINELFADEIVNAEIDIACITFSCNNHYVTCPEGFIVGSCGAN